MFGIGAMELAFVFLWLPAAAGLPVGLPPGPEDPLMAQMAPEKCLFYATWSPRAKADPKSNNETEKLLAEPEVQRFAATIQRELQRNLDRIAVREGDEVARVMAGLLPKVLNWAFTETGAIAVSEVTINENGPQVSAAAIARLGESGRDLPGLFKQLHRFAPPDAVKNVKLKGIDAYSIQFGPQAPAITWGVAKGYLVAGVGSGSLEQLLDRMNATNGKVPAWLVALQKNAKVDRRSSLAYLDVQAVLEIARLAGGEMANHYIDAIGVANVKTIESVTGLDATGFLSRTLVRIDGEPQGIFALIDAPPLTKDELRVIPRDAYAAVAVRCDFSQIMVKALEMVDRMSPDASAELRESLRRFEDSVRFQIQEDILDALGDSALVYASPSTGGFMVGWTAAIEVKDQKRLEKLIARFTGMLQAGPGGPDGRMPVVKTLNSSGYDIDYLVLPDSIPITPAWCVTEKEVVVGLFPQSIIGHLSNYNSKNSLVDHPAVKELWGEDDSQGPLSLTYIDTQTLFSVGYPLLQFAASAAFSQARRDGIELDASMLPASSALTPHLLPTVGAVRRVKEGIEVTQHQTFPGGSIGASAPVTMALLLPAVQAARGAGARVQSTNNLKQILLAMHNFHDVYNNFPPAYNVDEDGKPLLSWRVHILPFVEQQALYEQFHFDEPWDSEHNKALIAQMPQVYKSPRSQAGEGMTTYVTPRSEDSVFPEPADGTPKRTRGMGLANVTDGTSNTIAVVEVDDDNAVIWTKPDDYEYTDEDPLLALRNTWGEVFLAAFADGSVQALPISIGADVLKAMFTRNGGEVVQRP